MEKIVWIGHLLPTAAHGKRMVYIKHARVPFVGLITLADTAFSTPAFIKVKGKRLTGYVTPADGLAYQQSHEAGTGLVFRHHTGQGE